MHQNGCKSPQLDQRYTYCAECTCTKKKCHYCREDKELREFTRTTVPHLIRIKINKENGYACNNCNDDRNALGLNYVLPRFQNGDT